MGPDEAEGELQWCRALGWITYVVHSRTVALGLMVIHISNRKTSRAGSRSDFEIVLVEDTAPVATSWIVARECANTAQACSK